MLNNSHRWLKNMKQVQSHRGQHMLKKHQLSIEGKKPTSLIRDLISDLPNHIIKVTNLEAPCIYQAPKISRRKLTLLKTYNKVNNGLKRRKSQSSNIKIALSLKINYTKDAL